MSGTGNCIDCGGLVVVHDGPYDGPDGFAEDLDPYTFEGLGTEHDCRVTPAVTAATGR